MTMLIIRTVLYLLAGTLLITLGYNLYIAKKLEKNNRIKESNELLWILSAYVWPLVLLLFLVSLFLN